MISQVEPFRDKFGLDDTQLTVTLAAVPVVAGVGSVLAGVLAPKIGSGAVLRVAALGVAAMTAVTGFVDQLAFFYVAVALFGLFLGAVDASMNMQGTAVQRRTAGASWPPATPGGASPESPLRWLRSGPRTILPSVNISVARPSVGVVISLVAGPGLLKRTHELGRSAAGRRMPQAHRASRLGGRLYRHCIDDYVYGRCRHHQLERHLPQRRALGHGAVVPSALFAYLVFQFSVGPERTG